MYFFHGTIIKKYHTPDIWENIMKTVHRMYYLCCNVLCIFDEPCLQLNMCLWSVRCYFFSEKICFDMLEQSYIVIIKIHLDIFIWDLYSDTLKKLKKPWKFEICMSVLIKVQCSIAQHCLKIRMINSFFFLWT